MPMVSINKVVPLFCIITACSACIPVSAPDGVIPIPVTEEPQIPVTQTPPISVTTVSQIPVTQAPRTCRELDNMASVFLNNDVTFEDMQFGRVPASDTCTTCDGGRLNYYNSTSSATPATTIKESMGGLTSATCPNMCMCEADGTCWMLSDNTIFGVDFWQYCSDGICGVYTVIIGDSDNEGIITLDGSRIITGNDQAGDFDNNFTPPPVSNRSAYIDVASIG
uniref:Apple domain-containing protein n=1 Tax=Panagrellus redivivus TaxID=6233 RepID=A0A7E5A062_PANRE